MAHERGRENFDETGKVNKPTPQGDPTYYPADIIQQKASILTGKSIIEMRDGKPTLVELPQRKVVFEDAVAVDIIASGRAGGGEVMTTKKALDNLAKYKMGDEYNTDVFSIADRIRALANKGTENAEMPSQFNQLSTDRAYTYRQIRDDLAQYNLPTNHRTELMQKIYKLQPITKQGITTPIESLHIELSPEQVAKLRGRQSQGPEKPTQEPPIVEVKPLPKEPVKAPEPPQEPVKEVPKETPPERQGESRNLTPEQREFAQTSIFIQRKKVNDLLWHINEANEKLEVLQREKGELGLFGGSKKKEIDGKVQEITNKKQEQEKQLKTEQDKLSAHEAFLKSEKEPDFKNMTPDEVIETIFNDPQIVISYGSAAGWMGGEGGRGLDNISTGGPGPDGPIRNVLGTNTHIDGRGTPYGIRGFDIRNFPGALNGQKIYTRRQLIQVTKGKVGVGFMVPVYDHTNKNGHVEFLIVVPDYRTETTDFLKQNPTIVNEIYTRKFGDLAANIGKLENNEACKNVIDASQETVRDGADWRPYIADIRHKTEY